MADQKLEQFTKGLIDALIDQADMPTQDEIESAWHKISLVMLKTYSTNIKHGNKAAVEPLLDCMGLVQTALLKWPRVHAELKRQKELIEAELRKVQEVRP